MGALSSFVSSAFVIALLFGQPTLPALTVCSAGNVPCLIAAMEAAQTNGRQNIIVLRAGTYALTVPYVPAPGPILGGLGLPEVNGRVRIIGAGMDRTVIERRATAYFRFVSVASGAALTMEGLTLTGGYVGLSEGGAIFNEGETALVNVAVRSNYGERGGGIYSPGPLTIRASRFTKNNAGHPGGAILSLGMLDVRHSVFEENLADSGAGIRSSGLMTIQNSLFTGNQANNSPGILNFSTSPVTIANSSFIGNTTRAISSGVVTNTGMMSIVSSTFAENDIGGATSGGGVVQNRFGGSLSLLNVTVADNNAGGRFEPDVFGVANLGGALTLRNVIVVRNPELGGDCLGAVMSLGHNIIGNPGALCGVTLLSSDLTGNGGLGTLMANVIPLLPGSPAIDSANASACPTRDQLGFPRVDGDANGSVVCDRGAVEFIWFFPF